MTINETFDAESNPDFCALRDALDGTFTVRDEVYRHSWGLNVFSETGAVIASAGDNQQVADLLLAVINDVEHRGYVEPIEGAQDE